MNTENLELVIILFWPRAINSLSISNNLVFSNSQRKECNACPNVFFFFIKDNKLIDYAEETERDVQNLPMNRTGKEQKGRKTKRGRN